MSEWNEYLHACACRLANAALRFTDYRLNYIRFPLVRFTWRYPDRETVFVVNPPAAAYKHYLLPI